MGPVPAILVTDNTTLLVPSQRLIKVTLLATALAGCPGRGLPLTPKTGGTAPTGAPLTAKMDTTRVFAPLVKFRLILVITPLALATLITQSCNRGTARPPEIS